MKKMTRSLIAVITILVFTLTSSAVFADSTAAVKNGIDAAKDGKTAVTEQIAPKALDTSAIQPKSYTVKSTGTLNAKTLNYASSTKPGWEGLQVQGKGSNVWEYWTLGVKTSGKLYMDVYSDDDDSQGYIEVAVGTISNGKITTLGSTAYLSPGETREAICGKDVTAGKTYVVAVSSDDIGLVAVRPYALSYKTRTLKAGKTMISSGYKGDYNDSAVKYKIKPTKSGYITVGLKEYGYDKSAGYVQILNKKKKIASDKLWYYQGSDTSYVVFGVKKGVTYYLKVTGCQGTYDNYYAYGIKYKITKSPVRKNTKRSKSVKLKRKGSWKKTVLLANRKSGNQWYKFKVAKKRTTVIKFDGTNIKSGTVKMTLYRGKKKIDTTKVHNGEKWSYKVTYGTTWYKANRGTYYIKVHKSKKATGQYRIKYSK